MERKLIDYCPFCQSEKTRVTSDNGYWVKLYYVECEKCGATGPRGHTKDIAIKKWNNE